MSQQYKTSLYITLHNSKLWQIWAVYCTYHLGPSCLSSSSIKLPFIPHYKKWFKKTLSRRTETNVGCIHTTGAILFIIQVMALVPSLSLMNTGASSSSRSLAVSLRSWTMEQEVKSWPLSKGQRSVWCPIISLYKLGCVVFFMNVLQMSFFHHHVVM